mmetsp:Transcript_272/g.667  ORF Transcript_272/g.667 Transcript_272/m.667 type:complete len:220 (-) Transcript_272:63-722(-)
MRCLKAATEASVSAMAMADSASWACKASTCCQEYNRNASPSSVAGNDASVVSMASMRALIWSCSTLIWPEHSSTSSINTSSMATKPAFVSIAAANDAATASSDVLCLTSCSCTNNCSSRRHRSIFCAFASASCCWSCAADAARSRSAAISRSNWKRRAATSSPMTSSTCFLRSCDRSSCVCRRATSKFLSLRAENSPSTLSERVIGAGGAGAAGPRPLA